MAGSPNPSSKNTPVVLVSVCHGLLSLGFLLVTLAALFLPGSSGASSSFYSEDKLGAVVFGVLCLLHGLVTVGLLQGRRWRWILTLVMDAVLLGLAVWAAQSGGSLSSSSGATGDEGLVTFLYGVAVVYGVNLVLLGQGWVGSKES
ncbi:MAG: hypothetical protein EP343_13290 [Deltaproteobacteria bacterium]|nr:MAG: hypothetical protein EP343_13290 [Deltaproteobacteria bacterium]